MNIKLTLFITVFILFFNCSTKNNNLNTVFIYNEHKNISSLDPAFAKDIATINITNQLFNGLVQMDDSLTIKPCIAKYWTIDSTSTRYTFSLRKDVNFHKHYIFGKDSTRVVNATDFEYSLLRLCDAKIASPGSWLINNLEDITSINDSVLEIKLKSPDPSFLGKLSMKYCSVVPKEIVEHYGNNFRSNPIGTGPFKFKRWIENTKLVLRKNHNYFETDSLGNALPYLEAVSITFLPDKQSEYLQFIQGNLDYITGLDDSYKDDILTTNGKLRQKHSDKIKMLQSPYLNTEYLGFYLNSNKDEVSSNLIRKAINYGFNREKMMLYLRNGIGIAANGGFIPKGLPGYSNTIGFSYNPTKAKLLINKYKKITNNTNPKVTLTTTNNYLSFCEYIQKELKKLDLEISINVIPASALKESKANGKLDFFRASWVADYPDAENYLSLFYSKNFAPNGPNYTHFKNDYFDTLYEAAYLENSTNKRINLYKKMDSIVMKNAPIIPLFYDEVVRFTNKNVINLGINPTNTLNLKNVKKK